MEWMTQWFMHPTTALIGFGLMALPIVIHLLNQLRYKKVRFAAMEFLLESELQNRRRVMMEQWLLLLLRILMIGLLGILFARLLLGGNALSLLQSQKTHHVFIIDDSLSMHQIHNGQRLYDQALESVQEFLAEASRQATDQSCTIIRASQPSLPLPNFNQRRLDETVLSDFVSARESLSRQSSPVALQSSEVLKQVVTTFPEDDAEQLLFHFVSDYRTSDWQQASSWDDVWKEITLREAVLNCLVVGNPSAENVAISQLKVQTDILASGLPAPLSVTIENRRSAALIDAAMKIQLNGTALPRQFRLPEIPAGESLEYQFEVLVDQPGIQTVEVAIGADSLSEDNTRFLVFDVPPINQVLIADGTEDLAEAQYLANAISANPELTGISATLVDADGLSREDWSKYAAVYLLNLPSFSPELMATLNNYLEQGGGVMIALGDQVQPAQYNTSFASGEKPLLPFELNVATSSLEEIAETTLPDILFSDDPVVSVFKAEGGLLGQWIRINQYFPPGQESNSEAWTENPVCDLLASLRNEDPLLLRQKVGQGQLVWLMTSIGPMGRTPDARWHNWPVDPNVAGYTVLNLELARDLIGEKFSIPSVHVGEAVEWVQDPTEFETRMEILPPETNQGTLAAAELINLAQIPDSDMWRGEFQKTSQPGIYQVRAFRNAGPVEESAIAVNVDASESQLQQSEVAEIEKSIPSSVDAYVSQAASGEWLGNLSQGTDWRLILAIALGLLMFIEQFLAYRLGFHTQDQPKKSRWSNPVMGGAS